MARPADAARIDPLSRGFAYAVVGGLLAVAAASFALSFAGLSAFARTALGLGPLAVLLPIVIDASILVFGASVILNTARRENAFAGWLLLVFSTTLSASLNAAHVIADGPAPGALPAWAAPAVAATIPFFLLASTEIATRTIVRVHPADDEPMDQPAEPSAPAVVLEPAPNTTSEPTAPAEGSSREPTTPAPAEPAADAAPTPIRSAQPKRKPAPRSRTAASASAVPPEREAEVNRLIDAALDAGVSRQAAADRVSEQTNLSISKSRVTRRAQARAQQQTQEAAS